MINRFPSHRGGTAVGTLDAKVEQQQPMRALTAGETAQVSGGFWLLYWLLEQEAH